MNNCLTIEQRMSVTESEIKAYAEDVSKKIVIRTSGADEKRDSNYGEAQLIKAVVSGALIAIRAGHNIDDAADTAEFIGMQLLPGANLPYEFPHTNCYDTIYIPIRKFVREIEKKVVDIS